MGSLKSSRAILAFYRRLPPGYPSAQRCNQRFTLLPCPRLGTFHVFQLFRNGKHIGLDPSVEYRPSCRVLPMGWASSVGIMQQVSRQVLLMKGLPKSLEIQKVDGIPRWFTQAVRGSSPERAWWQVNLDNFLSGESSSNPIKDQGLRLQLDAVQAWTEAGILIRLQRTSRS